jgi:hypothetical protein
VYAADASGRVQAWTTVDASSTSVSVSGMRTGRSYQFRVVAGNADGTAASDWLTVTAPSGLTSAQSAAFAALAAQPACSRR